MHADCAEQSGSRVRDGAGRSCGSCMITKSLFQAAAAPIAVT